MTQDQKDCQDMQKRVLDYGKVKTIAISNTRPGFIAGLNKLKSDSIDKIDEMEAKQQQLLKGFTDNKAAKRQALDVLLFHHTSGTYAWAASTNNSTLQGQMRYTNSYIINITDESIVNTTNDLIALIEPSIAVTGLNDMGVDATSLQELKDARDAYHEVESEPVEMIQMRKSYTTAIDDLIVVGRTILVDICDKSADTLKATQKTWWDGYHAERVKISTGRRHNTIEGTVYVKADIEASRLEGLYGGSVVAKHEDGTVYTAKMDEEGHYKMVKVHSGIFSSIKFIAPSGFQDFEMGAFRLKKGSVVHKNVALAKVGDVEGGRPVAN
jgi:hypothetical protein